MEFKRIPPHRTHAQNRVGDKPLTKGLIIGGVVIGTLFILVAPLAIIFIQAFSAGAAVYAQNLKDPATLHAIWLTVLTAIVVVPINIGFGIAAAWAVTRFEFFGKNLLITLIEIPFSVSPIIAGVAYLFVYGAQGLFGPTLEELGIKIMFAVPAIFLASMFVTAPFVARELIPLMQVQGSDDEEAALSLGAPGWRMFLFITLPNVKWALLYGAILCNARVMGEFGAVSVVSGNIRNVTNTLPLHIELLYHDYNAVGAFAAATVLASLAVVTILARAWVERYDEGRAEVKKRMRPGGH
ncbi:ABC transporter permease [Terrihabitans soli]|uniref:ABC transporter permease n=1 Tax=Terrihabitans soli TaxID=708113 RepID=A0A6S6QX66_9HYPH|nr:sulfate ABC transporter permease subunit CysW [Terrihabitans soli]BCJ92145.1 ABC transporter permease [Terrihabitans soli]